jgi:hypothetical protein
MRSSLGSDRKGKDLCDMVGIVEKQRFIMEEGNGSFPMRVDALVLSGFWTI